jgi:uncharacterized membrane protein YhaH (DUF805 family)
VLIAALWLLTLLAATVALTVKRLSVVLLVWMLLNVFIPQLHPDPRLISIVALLPQASMIILVVLAFRNWPESSGTRAVIRGDASLSTIPDESRA